MVNNTEKYVGGEQKSHEAISTEERDKKIKREKVKGILSELPILLLGILFLLLCSMSFGLINL